MSESLSRVIQGNIVLYMGQYLEFMNHWVSYDEGALLIVSSLKSLEKFMKLPSVLLVIIDRGIDYGSLKIPKLFLEFVLESPTSGTLHRPDHTDHSILITFRTSTVV